MRQKMIGEKWPFFPNPKLKLTIHGIINLKMQMYGKFFDS